MPLLGRRRTSPARRRPTITRPRGRALTAAAEQASRPPGGRLRRLHQPWQSRAASYYDTIPETWYPSQFYARSLQRTRFFAAVLNDEGEPEESTDQQLTDLFERIQDPGGGGRSELAAAYGRLMFLIGDGYLTVTAQDGDEAWEFLSPLELKLKPGGRPDRPQDFLRLRAPGLTPEELSEAGDEAFDILDGEARVWRFYRKHPIWSAQADSPVRPILDLYELLHRLTLAAAAESTSRAAGRGGFYLPDELTLVDLADPNTAEDPDEDPTMRIIIETAVAAIENPGSAEAMAPIMVRGPSVVETGTGTAVPMKDCLGPFAFGPDRGYAEADMWEKTIDRIGNGLDLPRAVVTGEARNHWGDWAIDEQGYRLHVAPVTVGFCENVTAAYLRPAAVEAGVKNADRVVVWYDPAEAVNHPDEVKTSMEALDRGAVGFGYVREKIGATDEDAPTDDEFALILALKGKAVPADQQQDGETSPADGGRGGDVDEGTPDQPDPADEARPQPLTASAVQAAKVVGAAELLVERARELAGARLVNRSQGCEPCRLKLAGVPKPLVAATLGREMVREIIDGHTPESELVDGAALSLVAKLREWGVNGEWPERLAGLVEQHALRTLYEREPPPLPPGFAAAASRAVR